MALRFSLALVSFAVLVLVLREDFAVSAIPQTLQGDFYEAASQPGEKLLRMQDDSKFDIYCIGVKDVCIRVQLNKASRPVFTTEFESTLKEVRSGTGDARRRLFCVSEKVSQTKANRHSEVRCFYYLSSAPRGPGRLLKFDDFEFRQVTYVEDPEKFPARKVGPPLKLTIRDSKTAKRTPHLFYYRLEAF